MLSSGMERNAFQPSPVRATELSSPAQCQPNSLRQPVRERRSMRSQTVFSGLISISK